MAVPQGYQLDGGVMVASGGARGAPRRGTRELMEAYREQPWLRAVTGRIAKGVASARWVAYVRTETPTPEASTFGRRHGPDGTFRDVATAPRFRWGVDKGVKDRALTSGTPEQRARRRRDLASAGLLREVTDHPCLDVLAHPNSELTGRSSMQLTQTWLDLKGEAFWLMSADKSGTPTGFWALPPHWVTEVPTDAAPTFTISTGNVQMKVDREAVVWFRDPDPANPYGRGTGVAESLGDELETDEFAAKYLKNWFFNNAMPSFIVSFEGASAAELKVAREKWEADHRGYWNAHRAHFAGGKMNAVRLDASFRDQQIADMRRLSRDTVAQVFCVPPEMIGIIENSNRATIQAARYIYALGVEFPRCEYLRAELQEQFASRWDEALCLEVEVAIPDDEQRRLDVFRALPGAFSVNEWRGEAGYEPLQRFDGVFPPLEMPGQEPQQKPTEEPSATPAADTEAEDEGESEAPARGKEPAWVRHLGKQ